MNKITFPLKPQMKRPEVGNLHQALTFLGFQIAETERASQRYGASTRAAVREFQRDHQVPDMGEVDEATAIVINGILDERGALDPQQPDVPIPYQPIVRGTVLHSDGTPLDGLRVRAFHRRLAGDDPLGKIATTDVGQYNIAYSPPPETNGVDLFVRVYDDKQTILGVSAIHLGAGEEEELNVTVEDERFRGPSGFARATAALSSQVASAQLDELDGNDVALLVRSTGISRQSVTAWIASKRLAERSGVADEALYGLVRIENTASLPRLLGRSSTQLYRGLTEAARTNIISFAAGERARETVASLKRLAVELSASTETPGSLGRLLATTRKASSQQQRIFLERYVEHEGPVQDLWGALRQDPAFGDETVDDLQLSLQLGTLTANHPPLVMMLRSSGLERSSQTAALTREDWHGLLQSETDGQIVGVPANIKGDTETERIDNYITLLTERTALAFPTAHVARTLKTMPGWKSSTSVAFLDANPDFNLVTANIKQTLASPDVVIQPDWDLEKLESDLSTLQRVTRVAPKGREENVVNGLLTKGYASAFSISRKSSDTFVRHTGTALGDEATAREVYRNAQFQVSRALGTYSMMHPSVAGPTLIAIGGISDKVSSDATWASLFGNVDYCTCEHCRSIYSPAAYLVDLLAWLDGHELNGQTAFELLDARRPDIKRIQLSCENTNTVLPYVDLVNEILEVRVLNASGNTATAVPQASTATSEELLADPEYLHPEVYDEHLASALYPDLLPFDLWGELGRVYFEHLGVRRSDLMEALRRQRTPSVNAISAERLGLGSAQWNILTGAARYAVWRYWGYRSASPQGTDYKTDLSVVSNFLHRARLEYDELLDLLHTRFANPNDITIVGADCSTDEMRLENLTDEDLGRMHRYLRLWRNRGWSMLELDKSLHAMNLLDLDATSLHTLANLDRLQELSKAPLLDILCWWSVIDTFEDRPEKDKPVKSLYQRVFLNRAVDASADEPEYPFALNTARDGLRNTVSWDEVRPQLQAALGINADELSLLVDETVDGLPNTQRVVTGTDVTIEDLSALYRHVSLARTLKLKVEELFGLMRITGINPFDIAATGETLRLVETVSEIDASGFSLDELHYLLEHDADAETRVGVTDENIGGTLVEIRDGLARIETDFVVTPDPSGEVTARYLGALLDAEALSAVMEALQTPADGSNNAELAAVLTDNLGSLFTFDADAVIAHPVEERFNTLVALLAPYLKEIQSNALIVEKIATFTGRGLDSAEDLLSLRVGMTIEGRTPSALTGLRQSAYISTEATEITPDDDPEAFAALRRLFKVALVLTKLEVDIEEQLWLFEVGVVNGLLNPVMLPTAPQPVPAGAWAAWTRLVELFALREGLPGGEPSLVELLQLLDAVEDPAVAEETFRSELAGRTDWLSEDIDTLIAAFGLRFPDDWRDGQALRRLVDAFALIRRTGVSVAQADVWATADIDVTQAEALRLAAKSKHDEAQWPTIAHALRDPVREKQRAALVAYMIAQTSDYDDEPDLYSDLLIDVEMDPCMLTSRIKQAISSVQLFVQRTFLNLEDGIQLTRDDRDQWEWMKNYRVWEANRKVFLYPENWIEPELRSNKSHLFEQLENSLLQGEVTDALVEKAYTEYLEGLLKIGRLEVMAIYHQLEEDEDGTVDILHVVARTQGHPQEYYYRQWIDAREWTPWEKLEVEIEANHIILAIYDRRLFVFWPMVVQKAEGDEESNTDFFEMKLAWVERMNEQWGARKLSEQFFKIDGMWESEEREIYFRIGTGDGLVVECRQPESSGGALLPGTAARSITWARPTGSESSGGARLLGTFALNPRTGSVAATSPVFQDGYDLVTPGNWYVERMRFKEILSYDDTGQFTLVTPFQMMAALHDENGQPVTTPEQVELLPDTQASTSSGVSYIYPHQYGEFTSQHGVFLDDDQHTFHVLPETASDLDDLPKEDKTDPSSVGTTTSGYDVFVPEQKWPEFESDLPWDEGPLDQLDPLSPGANPRASAVLGEERLESDFSADDLSNSQLQLSQNQLFEVETYSDTLTLPKTKNYRFSLFYHPYVRHFLKELRRLGVEGLLDPNPEGPAESLVRQQKERRDFFEIYEPTNHVLEPYPILDIDFELGGAYADYNWEIFFHAPLLIASRLLQNQRFEEARKWYHFIFDPTNRSDDEDPLRFWKIKPFYREADAPISDFLELASSPDDSAEAEDARKQYDQQLDAWLEDPFNPHAIARLRTTAYQKAVVMKYLDNLIAWGDHLFRRDTIESINEATQLYVLALELLGARPDALPPRALPITKTFEQVREDLEASVLNNPLVQLENVIFKPTISGKSNSLTAPNDISRVLFNESPNDPGFYFCIPPNEKLLGYWDTVEDRLFKLRHCMNIEGVVRQLPLFEPPIDPGMLVRARAAGVDLSSALADLNAPLPHYRFNAMLQKAYALNQTVRSLGAALLNALEKEDAEALAGLRANHEVALLDAIRQVKKLAIDEARHTLTAAERSLKVVKQRAVYYQGLIKAGWLPEEQGQLNQMVAAIVSNAMGSGLHALASIVGPIPTMQVGNSGFEPEFHTELTNGGKLALALNSLGSAALATGAALSASASIDGIKASYERRSADWDNQLQLAKLEIKQIEKQIEAARVRVALAKADQANHERQLENARSVRSFMEQKYTNAELYRWMVGQLSSLYFQSYQLAYDLAKQAEQAYRHELALPDATFISFGYWDSLKKGLLAGERLQYDLERMDASYLENNRREYEITKHVSLALLDPYALLNLTTGGTCQFSIPEALFDLDYPGHYLRRIKSISVTVPCVTGPYTNVPARLTLVSSRTRTDPNASGDYAFDAAGEDSRFQVHTGAVQSIVVSAGREDAGLFSADHRDERYLPFEGAGAISDWNLELTSALPTFDWSTITDVVLHVRYTAREGGETLRAAAIGSLTDALAGIPLRHSFSAKREFPTQWNAFLAPAQGASQAQFMMELSENRFPYLTHDAGLSFSELQLIAIVKDPGSWTPTDVEVITGNQVTSTPLAASDSALGGHPSATVAFASDPPCPVTVSVPTNDLGAPSEWIEDLVVLVTYEITVDGG